MTYRNESLVVKLARFRRSVMDEAEAECAEIEQELARYREQELSACARSLSDKNAAAAGREIERLQLRYARELSALRKEYREKLLLLREEYTGELRRCAEDRLLQFSASQEYKKFMMKKIRRLSKMNLEKPRLLIKPGDEALSAEIAETYSCGITIETDCEIKLGGLLLICEGKRIIIDETLDFALNKQMELFRSSGKFGVWLAPLG